MVRHRTGVLELRRYVPTVATILFVALCLTAASWQRARMHYKQSLRAQFETAVAAPPLVVVDLPRVAADWQALRYRPVELQGTFDASRQFFLDNKVQQGQVGYDVVAPLRLADGRVILVDRGWVAQGRSRAELPHVPPPPGGIILRGRIDLPATSYVQLQSDAAPRAVWQHLDVARFASMSGLSVLPVIVEQTAPAGEGDDLTRSWPAPDFGVDTHRIYMVQWYAFAALALIFWAIAHWPRAWRRGKTGGAARG